MNATSRLSNLLVMNDATPAASSKRLFEYLTLNADTAKVRTENLEGRAHWVVPMVMMVEGVLNGSRGRLHYPASSITENISNWDSKPIVVYHPQIDGQGITACSPHVFNTSKVGVILNTGTDCKGPNGRTRLTAEAWIDKEKAKKVDKRVVNAINAKKMMEVSTGLFLDTEAVQNGEFDGKPYDRTTCNYRPDHLALLPDKRGACSIADGAGLIRNDDGTAVMNADVLKQHSRKANNLTALLKDGAIAKKNVCAGHRKASEMHAKAACGYAAAGDESSKARHLRKAAKHLAKANAISGRRMVGNELSTTDTYSALNRLLSDYVNDGRQSDYPRVYCYINDVFPSFVVYCVGSKCFKLGYKVKNDLVQLSTDKPVPVTKVTQYKDDTGKIVGNYNPNHDARGRFAKKGGGKGGKNAALRRLADKWAAAKQSGDTKKAAKLDKALSSYGKASGPKGAAKVSVKPKKRSKTDISDKKLDSLGKKYSAKSKKWPSYGDRYQGFGSKPKKRSKPTIQSAAKGLAQKGYKLGAGRTEGGTTSYKVTDRKGKTSWMSTKSIKKLLGV